MKQKILQNIQLFYFDLDGTTFLSDNKDIDPSSIKVFEKLKQKGFKLGIATGRHHLEIEKQLKIIKPNLPIISVNGTMLYDSKLKKIQNLNSFSIEKTKNIIEIIKKHYINFSIYTDNQIIFYSTKKSKKYKNFFKQEYEKSIKEGFPLPYIFLNSNDKLPNCKSNKFMLYGSEITKEIFSSIQAKFQEENINAQVLYAYSDFIEIFSKDSSKAEALKKVATKNNFKLENIAFFGDGINDIEICKEVGVCVAMGNAWEELKKAATVITKTNIENGIYYFFETMDLEILN